jgi:hypothetical protein
MTIEGVEDAKRQCFGAPGSSREDNAPELELLAAREEPPGLLRAYLRKKGG